MKARMAVLSEDRLHRFSLLRLWDDRPKFVVVGLNPSTADEANDDPTIRRCVGFAKREGCGALIMLNLFSLRATDPDALITARTPNDPANDVSLRELSKGAAFVVAAWGANASNWPTRVREVLALLGNDVRCLGITARGHPRHPLYVRADAPLVPFARARA